MTQTEFLNDRGELMKSEGIAVVADHNETWLARALVEIQSVLRVKGEVTSDDLRTLPTPGHPNAIGAVFNVAARQGLIVRDGFRKSKAPSCHGRYVSVWRKK